MTTKMLLQQARTKAQSAKATAAAGKRLYQLSLEQQASDPDAAARIREMALEMLAEAKGGLALAQALNDTAKTAK